MSLGKEAVKPILPTMGTKTPGAASNPVPGPSAPMVAAPTYSLSPMDVMDLAIKFPKSYSASRENVCREIKLDEPG